MARLTAAVIVSLLAGLALSTWLFSDDGMPSLESTNETATRYLDPTLPIAERLRHLERIVAQERDARLILEDQLSVLIDEIERIDSDGPRALQEREAEVREARRNAAERPRDYASAIRNMQERRRNMLLKGGFSEDEADRVMAMESAAQYEAMRVAHEARRADGAVDWQSTTNNPQSLLRLKLGDDDYARYLTAQGQPTAVQVSQVLADTPGSRAGLQPGDEIVRYNGDRIFTVSDLRALTLQGAVGEDVVIEIDRDGVRMQLVVQRGPVGITGSSANIRGMNWWGGS